MFAFICGMYYRVMGHDLPKGFGGIRRELEMVREAWTYRDISLAIHLCGWTQDKIAKEVGVAPSTVSYAIRTGSSIDVCRFIAKIINQDQRDLWPNRFPSLWRNGDDGS
ncbi:MAG: helix-turn-helix domain-containing protein [Patescibacteria group bacterium]|nr:helix-turn-helix domain-containing protein [Patescibacteria group bacterium]